MIILSILFFVTALLYASVGFGGGSTYLALLLIWEIPYYIFPVIALVCNIFVVSGNSFNYIKAGNLNLKLLLPYLIGSIPLAFIGGSLPIEKNLFEFFLFLVLAFAGIMLLINFRSYNDEDKTYLDLNPKDRHVVSVRSHVYLANNNVFQYTESRHQVDKFRFTEFSRRQKH